jgi:hypothetical protein
VIGRDTGNASITGATGVLSLAAESGAAADDGVWWTSTGTSNYLVAHADGTFHPSSEFSDATLRAMTETMLPRELGTSLSQTATNIYGGDRFFSDLVNDLLPAVGGSWGATADAGVFGVTLGSPPGASNLGIGARAVRLLAA